MCTRVRALFNIANFLAKYFVFCVVYGIKDFFMDVTHVLINNVQVCILYATNRSSFECNTIKLIIT